MARVTPANGDRVDCPNGRRGTLVSAYPAGQWLVLLDDGPKVGTLTEPGRVRGPRNRTTCDRCNLPGHHAFDCTI